VHRLATTIPWLVAALFLATGSWWLANVALLSRSAYVDVPALSAQTSFLLLLGQLLLIGLFAVHNDPGRVSDAVLGAVAFSLPLWPLFALLWVTSQLSLSSLVVSQVAAVILAALMTVAGRWIVRVTPDRELGSIIRSAAGVSMFALAWGCRGPIQGWMLP
jgi:hypothetical protein